MQSTKNGDSPKRTTDIVNAALTWYQMPNGITERALRAAVGALLRERSGEVSPAPKGPSDLFSDEDTAPQATGVMAPPTIAGEFEVYSDGSALRNPGPSGCGWVVLSGKKVVYEGFESIGHGTNQIAEIRAAAHGLNDLPAGSTVDVHTDSLYVVKTMKGEFKKKANLEHWAFIDEAVRRHKQVRFHHVRGHAGHDMNERADVLANKGAAISKKRLAGSGN
ncbi:ribonuclease HI [Paraburkholderia bryophila]|uniref:Ribonuclease HI n=1 Tax=Paraburkholderia bryophila TaxID=420952 RepID=A0A7Y9WNP1_9BURK|nr:ribonuclease H [Paraburkholderia bryophila]NYH24237.1 ribonuclease HI [Paraburkholderia bryophila]